MRPDLAPCPTCGRDHRRPTSRSAAVSMWPLFAYAVPATAATVLATLWAGNTMLAGLPTPAVVVAQVLIVVVLVLVAGVVGAGLVAWVHRGGSRGS